MIAFGRYLHSGVLFGLAIVLGALAGMSVNFMLSRSFVFARRGDLRRDEMVRFFLISLSKGTFFFCICKRTSSPCIETCPI